MMNKANSADGTEIAFERFGDGQPVILVSGALSDRTFSRPLAEQLAPYLTAITYDRRGRGDSGDTPPYAVEREIDDLAALLAAVGGTAPVYGHSSGAGLALRAAARGLPIAKLVLHEPPYGPDTDAQRQAARESAARIGAALAADDRRGALHLFFSECALPPETVDEISNDPAMKALAPTLAYDHELMGDIATGGTIPRDLAAAVTTPTLVLNGSESPDWIRETGRELAATIPNARHHVIEGRADAVPPEVLVPLLVAFIAA